MSAWLKAGLAFASAIKKTLTQMCTTTLDSIIMNDKEIRSPLFNLPLFMQGEHMIYDYLTEDCLFLTKKPNKKTNKKKISPLCVAIKKYVFLNRM